MSKLEPLSQERVVKAIVKLYKQVPKGQREGLTHLAHELGLLEQCKAALK